MKKALVAVVALATVVSACGSGSGDDARNVTIPGRDVLARILPLGVTFAPGQTAAVAVAGNRDSTCVIDHQGGLWCWGRRNIANFAGMPDISNVPVRVQIPGGQPVTAVSSGDSDVTCAVSAGRVYCWGWNAGRQAVPTSASRTIIVPTLVEGLTDVVDVVTSWFSSCARKADGSVWCWGSYEAYGLGGVAFTNRTIGGPIAMGNLGATKIVGADDTYCVVTANGTVSCWGRNLRGQAGVGNTNPVLQPTAVNFAEAIIDLSIGSGHSCAVLMSGLVQCWGYNSSYQLGNIPTNTYVLRPNYVDLRNDQAMSVSVSNYHSCILTSLNAVKCWGQYPGTLNYWWVVSAVTNLTNVMMITSNGTDVLCAVQWTGEVRCAGPDTNGMLGDGGANVTSATGVRVGSFGTAGVPPPAPTTSVAATTTTTTSTTIAGASDPTITVAPIPTNGVAQETTTTVAPGVATTATVAPPSTSAGAAPATTPTASPATTPAGPAATAVPAGSGVDAASTSVTVPQGVAPGAVARVLIIKKGRSVSDATIARFAGVGVPKKAKVTVTIKKSSKKFCARNGAKVTGAKRGTCTLTLKVTPKGQKPRVRVVTAQVVG